MTAAVHYREFWGDRKREELVGLLTAGEDSQNYVVVEPDQSRRFSLRPGSQSSDYASWVGIDGVAATPPINGLFEKRGGSLIDIDRVALSGRMQQYLDPRLGFEQARYANPDLAKPWARYDAKKTRENLMRSEGYRDGNILRYSFCPFDLRWAYVSEIRPLWNEPRPALLHVAPQAVGFFVTRVQKTAEPEGLPAYWSTSIGDDYLMNKHACYVPVVDNRSGSARPNLSPTALAWTTSLDLPPDADTARLVWHHALAVTYSPAYLSENAAGIGQGWPRIPLPNNARLLHASAALGARVAALLDADTPVPGVTTGALDPILAPIGVPATRPSAVRDWRLAGWGYSTKTGATMPGRGDTTARNYAPDEAATAAHAALLGARTLDVAMNGASLWRNIPEQVWEMHIGGYQVLKKWLSYRDASILDRPLTAEEVAHVQSVARRLSAIRLMGPNLDASFRACAAAHVALPSAEAEA